MAYTYKCDVSDYEDVKETANRVRQDVQQVDIVVCLKLFNFGTQYISQLYKIYKGLIFGVTLTPLGSNFYFNTAFTY